VVLKILGNQKGFTLIEILIVVAILASLVLIFSPNFGLFNKADGTALNAKAKSVETATFQYYIDNETYPYGVAPVATDFGAAASSQKLDLLTLVQSANGLGLSFVDTEADLNNFLTNQTVLVDSAALASYVKGSSANLADYVIVKYNSADAALYNGSLAALTAAEQAEIVAIDGYILSKETIKDNNGIIYNGTVRYTP
jgi:prepilin-type N-terminal cleavage/methylation domain-containing protein